MHKKIYLFELDSVRNTDQEALVGQEALFEEIAINGNTVVMTFNQFFDSRGFLHLFQLSQEYTEAILKLFKCGAIQLSQFEDYRTGTQYLLHLYDTAVLPNESYDFDARLSGLPVKYGQRRLIKLIVRSLQHNDISEISEYIDILKKGNNITDSERNELDELFIEITTEKTYIQIEEEGELIEREIIREVVKKTKSGKNDVVNDNIKLHTLEILKQSLIVIFRLSSLENVYSPPKQAKDLYKQGINDFLKKVIGFYEEVPDKYKRSLEVLANIIWDEVIDIGSAADMKKGQSTEKIKDRRGYYTSIQLYPQREKSVDSKSYNDNKEFTDRQRQYCKAIIDLCYNYAVESSISNISRHYDIDEITGDLHTNTFREDFLSRLEQYIDAKGERGHDFDARPISKQFDYTLFKPIVKKFRHAEEMFEASRKREINIEEIGSYEYHFKEEARMHKKDIRLSAWSKMGKYIISIGSLYLISQISGFFEEKIILVRGLGNSILYKAVAFFVTIIFWILWEYGISHIKFLPDVSESLSHICTEWGNWKISVFYKIKNHRNEKDKGNIRKRESIRKIRFVPQSIREYFNLIHQRSDLFVKVEGYPLLADEKGQDVKSHMIKNAELYSHNYGVTYRDNYHYMVVDPIVNMDGTSYEYSRLISVNSNAGVVIVPKYKDKYILLRQARHAIRREQYAFPRGFSEGNNLSNDVRREIREEIGGEISEFRELGKVSGDSGILASMPTIVIAKLNSYDDSLKSEGIVNIICVSKYELKQMIKNKQISDGYTLAALQLLEVETTED